jgi:hypothetical protein
MGGRKKTYRISPTAGAPTGPHRRRSLPRPIRTKARKHFLAAALVAAGALAATIAILSSA